MGDAINTWIHVLAAAVFIGPQIFLFVAAVPAIRTIADAQERRRVTRMVTTRFGWLGGAALVALLITGIINWYDADDHGFLDIDRYFVILQVKLTLVALVIVLTGLHGGLVGRRLLKLQESGASEEEIAQTRVWSVALSAANLLASLVILLCAALLDADWSKMS